jgi:outer membrane protein assembly factor BamA
VSLSERNFLGQGLQRQDRHVGQLQAQNVDFSFTKPYFMGCRFPWGIDLFATLPTIQEESSYKSAQIGGALRTGFRLDEYSSLGLEVSGSAGRDISGIGSDQRVSRWSSATEGESDQVRSRKLHLRQSRQPEQAEFRLPWPA